MKCPLCQTPALTIRNLEENIQASECSKCGGHWISVRQYDKWLRSHGPALPERRVDDDGLEVEDSQGVKLCPECGRIMIKYKVGHGLSFYLDRCGACGGVWLDRNEWRALESSNLHDELRDIFTAQWQKGILAEESARRLEAMYAEKFGADYKEIKRIKDWLATRPDKSVVLAYLGGCDGK